MEADELRDENNEIIPPETIVWASADIAATIVVE